MTVTGWFYLFFNPNICPNIVIKKIENIQKEQIKASKSVFLWSIIFPTKIMLGIRKSLAKERFTTGSIILVRFYLFSTMIKRQPQQALEINMQNRANTKPTQNQGLGHLSYQYYFNTCCSQLIQLSNNLIHQLLISEELLRTAIAEGVQPYKPSKTETKSDRNSTATHPGSTQGSTNHQVSVRNIILSNKKAKPKEEYSSSESFKPEVDAQQNWTFYNTNTSKKIVRDYSKAIFDFIQCNPDYVSQLFASLGIDQKSFRVQLQKYKGKVNSNLQFNAMFSQLQGNFAKALRIITFQYSRKHRISDIFGTYTFNYRRHLKYRSKILQNLKKSFRVDQARDL